MSRVRSYTYNIHIHSTHAGSYMYLNNTDITAFLLMIYLFLLFAFVMADCVLSSLLLTALWFVMSCSPHMLMRHHAISGLWLCGKIWILVSFKSFYRPEVLVVFRAPVSRLEDLNQTLKWLGSKLVGWLVGWTSLGKENHWTKRLLCFPRNLLGISFFVCRKGTDLDSWIISWLTDPGVLNWVGQHQLEPVRGNHLKLICYASGTALALFLHNSWISSLKDAWISGKPPAGPCNQRRPRFLLTERSKDME